MNDSTEKDALRERITALADEWDKHSDRLYNEARDADRDAAIVLRSKSGTYAVNAERLRDALDSTACSVRPADPEGDQA
jgi:hypothetical protein